VKDISRVSPGHDLVTGASHTYIRMRHDFV